MGSANFIHHGLRGALSKLTVTQAVTMAEMGFWLVSRLQVKSPSLSSEPRNSSLVVQTLR